MLDELNKDYPLLFNTGVGELPKLLDINDKIHNELVKLGATDIIEYNGLGLYLNNEGKHREYYCLINDNIVRISITVDDINNDLIFELIKLLNKTIKYSTKLKINTYILISYSDVCDNKYFNITIYTNINDKNLVFSESVHFDVKNLVIGILEIEMKLRSFLASRLSN